MFIEFTTHQNKPILINPKKVMTVFSVKDGTRIVFDYSCDDGYCSVKETYEQV